MNARDKTDSVACSQRTIEARLCSHFSRGTTVIIIYSECFYGFMTVKLSINLDNGQIDTHLLYFSILLLRSSTCFEHYMLIVRRLNCIDVASGIVTLKISEWDY